MDSLMTQWLSSLSPSTFALALLPFLVLSISLLKRSIVPSTSIDNEPPLFGKGRPDQQAALQEGYEKGIVFRIPIPHDEYTIIPPKYIDSIKAAPPSQLSVTENVRDRLFDSLTELMIPAHTVNHAVRREFPKHMDYMLPIMLEDVRSAVSKIIGPCAEWTPFTALSTITRITLMARARLFSGLDSNQYDQWADLVENYSHDMMRGIETLWACPKILRPYCGYLIPRLRSLRRSVRGLERLMEPVVEEHLSRDPSEWAKDAAQWHLNHSDDREKHDLKFQTLCQILLASVGTDAMAIITFHTLCELAAHPEYLAPLRDEARAFLAQSGGDPTMRDMSSLPKLDSFIKEVLRHNPIETISMNRTVKKAYTLPDGTVLAPGTHVGVASYAPSMDPTVFADPDAFDGWRFLKLRRTTEHGSQWDAWSPQLHSLHFGYGNHACPGRFFAIYMIKLIVTVIIDGFDVRNEKGVRPRNTLKDVRVQPDEEAKLLFKIRSD